LKLNTISAGCADGASKGNRCEQAQCCNNNLIHSYQQLKKKNKKKG